MRRASRRDNTHAAIRDAFRALGLRVRDIGGEFDLLVLDPTTGRAYMVDAKTKRSKQPGSYARTATQERLAQEGWPLFFATSVEDAHALAVKWRKAALPDEDREAVSR
ncbi:MAG TPA: hypothetical protein VFB99_02560 [Vicinamibacterales bacterium]|nr:hypothetical protein [Vicinamibacterales bacterium]